MGTELVPVEGNELSAKGREVVLMDGDLGKMTPDQRLAYIYKVCSDIGVNPLTRPFEYLKLNGKLQLYARKDCTEQLRANRKISLRIEERIDDTSLGGTYTVVVTAKMPDGREDQATGSVATKRQKVTIEYTPNGQEKKVYHKNEDGSPLLEVLIGDERANAIMKAETKAKRRATLSICGLGFLDEAEVETIPAKAVGPIAPITAQQSEKVLILVKNNTLKLAANLNPYGVTTLGRLNTIQADELIRFLEVMGE